jgi:hypothetical protein
MRTKKRRRSITSLSGGKEKNKVLWNCPICHELPLNNIAISGGKIRISRYTITEMLNTKCKNGHVWHFTRNSPSKGILGIYCPDKFIKACIRQLCFNKYILKEKTVTSIKDICPICREKVVERVYYCSNQDSKCKNGHCWHLSSSTSGLPSEIGMPNDQYTGNNDRLGSALPISNGEIEKGVCSQCQGKRKWYPTPIDEFPWEDFHSDIDIVSKFQMIKQNGSDKPTEPDFPSRKSSERSPDSSIEIIKRLRCPECNTHFSNKIHCIGQCIICKNNHVWHNEGNGYRKGCCPECRYVRWRGYQLEELITPDFIDRIKLGECPLVNTLE